VTAPRPEPVFSIELSDEEILEDLCWPYPPPGRWPLEVSRHRSNGRPTVRGVAKQDAIEALRR
jgi:hypothetical protein